MRWQPSPDGRRLFQHQCVVGQQACRGVRRRLGSHARRGHGGRSQSSASLPRAAGFLRHHRYGALSASGSAFEHAELAPQVTIVSAVVLTVAQVRILDRQHPFHAERRSEAASMLPDRWRVRWIRPSSSAVVACGDLLVRCAIASSYVRADDRG